MTVISGREKGRVQKTKNKKPVALVVKKGKKRKTGGMRMFPTVADDAIRRQ